MKSMPLRGQKEMEIKRKKRYLLRRWRLSRSRRLTRSQLRSASSTNELLLVYRPRFLGHRVEPYAALLIG
jgi:hypothetical protein